MRITKEITIDLQHREVTEPLEAVQCDANTRAVKVTLLNGGESWTPPAGAVASVAFKKPDNTSGWYDKLPDGTSACAVSGNTVTAVFAPQMLTAAGKVQAAVIFQDAKLNQLATFVFTVNVQANPAAGKGISNDYYKYATMEQISEAVDAWLTETEAEKNDFLSKADAALDAMRDVITTSENGPAIVCEESGVIISVSDSSDRLLRGLTLYGKTTQDGTPTPTSPMELVSVGDSGSIGVTIIGGSGQNAQILTASTPNGLPGIPVTSGGNYTDENGQQWICDEVDFARGVYVQRIQQYTFDGSSDEYWNYQSGYNGAFAVEVAKGNRPYDTKLLCNWSPLRAWSDTNKSTYYCFINESNMFTIGGSNITGMCATVADLRAKLAVQPIHVAYVRNTVKETALSAAEMAAYYALHSNKPNTTVFNDAGAGMKLGYVADTKLYIDNKFGELAAALVNKT